MRLGIGSYTYTWAVGGPGYIPGQPLDVFGLLEKAVVLGVSVVQLADNLPLHLLPESMLAEFARRAKAANVQVEVGTRGIGLDHLETYLRLAVLFRSPILRVVVDTADDHPSAEAVVSRLKSFVPALERAAICLAIENHDRFPVQTLRWIVDTLDTSSVGICLDTVNSFGSLEGPTTVVETLGPYVVNLHIKDFSIRRVSHQLGFVVEGTPAGKGRLDIPWLLEQLRRMNRDPNAILELWTPPDSILSATIAKEADWAAESIRYLRTLIQN
jgi:3-oxoisoapionate decarboxylase